MHAETFWESLSAKSFHPALAQRNYFRYLSTYAYYLLDVRRPYYLTQIDYEPVLGSWIVYVF